MKSTAKGEYGYIRDQKKKRVLITIGLFLLPVGIFIIGYFQTHTRKNLFTVVAILGCLPACKSAVTTIMMLLQKSADAAIVQKTKEKSGDLTKAFELVITAYEKTTPVDACVICGNEVACFSISSKADPVFFKKQVQKILTVNGFPGANVKLFIEEKPFLQRIVQLNQHKEQYRNELEETARQKEEQMKAVLLAIAL